MKYNEVRAGWSRGNFEFLVVNGNITGKRLYLQLRMWMNFSYPGLSSGQQVELRRILGGSGGDERVGGHLRPLRRHAQRCRQEHRLLYGHATMRENRQGNGVCICWSEMVGLPFRSQNSVLHSDGIASLLTIHSFIHSILHPPTSHLAPFPTRPSQGSGR